jgi:small-conductance mechanosensitive channel
MDVKLSKYSFISVISILIGLSFFALLVASVLGYWGPNAAQAKTEIAKRQEAESMKVKAKFTFAYSLAEETVIKAREEAKDSSFKSKEEVKSLEEDAKNLEEDAKNLKAMMTKDIHMWKVVKKILFLAYNLEERAYNLEERANKLRETTRQKREAQAKENEIKRQQAAKKEAEEEEMRSCISNFVSECDPRYLNGSSSCEAAGRMACKKWKSAGLAGFGR